MSVIFNKQLLVTRGDVQPWKHIQSRERQDSPSLCLDNLRSSVFFFWQSDQLRAVINVHVVHENIKSTHQLVVEEPPALLQIQTLGAKLVVFSTKCHNLQKSSTIFSGLCNRCDVIEIILGWPRCHPAPCYLFIFFYVPSDINRK